MTELGQPVYRITLNNALAMRLTGYALALFYVALGIVYVLGPSGDYRVGDLRTLVMGSIGVVAVFVGTILLHELVHGMSMRLFGATPKYGIGRINWLFAYAYATAPGVPFTLRQMTVICLAPLIVLTAASVGIGWLVSGAAGFAAVAFVTNFSGAAGDIWMVVQMWRFRNCRELRLVDMENGLDIYTSDPSASSIATALAARHRGGIVHRILLRWLVTSTLMFMTVMLLSVLFTVLNTGEVTIGPKWFPVATYSTLPDGGFGMTVDFNVILIVSLIGAVLSVMLARPSKPRTDQSAGGSPHPALL